MKNKKPRWPIGENRKKPLIWEVLGLLAAMVLFGLMIWLAGPYIGE